MEAYNFERELKHMISNGKMDEALKKALETAKSQGESAIYNDFILLSSRNSSLERQRISGVIDESTYSRSKNQITYAFLSLIPELRESTPSKSVKGEIKKSKKDIHQERIDDLKKNIETSFDDLNIFEQSRIEEELGTTTRTISSVSQSAQENIQNLIRKIQNYQEELLKLSRGDKRELALLKKDFVKNRSSNTQGIEIGENVLKLDINEKEVIMDLANLHVNIEDYKNAIIYYNRFLDLTPNDENALLGKARAFKAEGNLDGAIVILDSLLSINPENIISVLLEKGDIEMIWKNWEKALAIFEEALHINVKSFEAHYSLAVIQGVLGNTQKQLQYLEKALEINPNSVEALHQTGVVHYKLGNLKEGIIQLERAKKGDPGNPKIYEDLANAYMKLENYDEAIENFKKCLEIKPGNIDVINQLGNLYQYQKEYDQAIKYFEQVLDHQPDNITVLKQLGKNYLSLNDLDKSIEVFEKAKSLGPEDFEVYKYLAINHFNKTDRNDHITLNYFEKATSLNEGDAEVWKNLGKLYIELKEYETAMKAFRKVEEIEGKGKFEFNRKNPVTISAINTEGLSFFDDVNWNCQPGVNVLLGRNGYGKSYFLRFLISLLQKEQEISYNFFARSEGPAKVNIKLTQNNKTISIVRKNTKFDSLGKIPILAIPDVRYLDKSRESITNFGEEHNDLLKDGAYHFLYQKPFEGLLHNFLYELCLVFFDERTKYKNNDDAFKSIPIFALLRDIFKELTGNQFRFHSITRLGNARVQILVTTDGNESTPLPIQRASQGTLSVLSIFGLIFNFLRAVYDPDEVNDDQITQQKGIIIIDEVDAHLHPSWQKKIVYLLTRKFPNVQFFITAHSPLIVGGCKENEVSVLRKSEKTKNLNITHIPHDFIGWDTSDLYEEVFSIEEMDETFLEYQSKYSTIDSLRTQIDEMESMSDLSVNQKSKLNELREEELKLSQIEKILKKKDEQNLEIKIEELEFENRNLQYKIDQLNSKK